MTQFIWFLQVFSVLTPLRAATEATWRSWIHNITEEKIEPCTVFVWHTHTPTLLPSRKQNLSPPPLQSKHTELWAAGNPESPGLCKYCFNFYFRNKNCCEQETNLWPILFISQVIPVAILCINLVCLFHPETSCSVCLQFLVLCSWKWCHKHTV